MSVIVYREAYSEVLDILSHMNKEDVEKIPISFLDFLKKNASINYVSKLDHSKKIKDMNLAPKTQAVLAIIYKNYWCNKEDAEIFKKKLLNNELTYKEYQQNKLNDFYSGALFDKNKGSENQDITNEKSKDTFDKSFRKDIDVYEKSFFKRIINKFKKFFKLK